MSIPQFAPHRIFDVGMNDGKDTAFYLHRGYEVVAVEANPQMCEAAAKRFKDPLQQGRLHIENVAIHESGGVRPFYVSERNDWCSFDLSIASRGNLCYATIPMQCTTLSTLLEKYGVPFYLKIDIEGADTYCLKSLRAECLPIYVSVECGSSFISDVNRLGELGYRKFKLINQCNLLALPYETQEPLLHQLRRRFKRKLRNAKAGRWRDDWSFEYGCTGGFGEEADGAWLSLNGVLERRASWLQSFERLGLHPYSFWYDLHAAR